MQRNTSQRSALSPNEDSMPQMLTKMLAGTPYLVSILRNMSAHCVDLRVPMAMRDGDTMLST
jgi:hypothetical protein